LCERSRRGDGGGDPGVRRRDLHSQSADRRNDEEQLMAAMTQSAARRQRSPRPGSDSAVTVSSHVVLGIWSVLVVAPLIWVFISSFKTDREIVSGDPLALPQQWNLENF